MDSERDFLINLALTLKNKEWFIELTNRPKPKISINKLFESITETRTLVAKALEELLPDRVYLKTNEGIRKPHNIFELDDWMFVKIHKSGGGIVHKGETVEIEYLSDEQDMGAKMSYREFFRNKYKDNSCEGE